MGIMQRAVGWMVYASNIEQQWNTVRDLEGHWAPAKERGRVLQSKAGADNSWELIVSIPQGWPLEDLQAGQWVRLGIEIDGIIRHRCYSVANSPEEAAEKGYLQFGISRHDQGLVSNAVRNLEINSKVSISPPEGELTLRSESANAPLLIAGGSGITPLRAILIHALTEREDITLWHSVRLPEEALYREEFTQLQEIFPQFSYQLFITGEGSDDYTGRIHRQTFCDLLQSSADGNFDIYLCGSHYFTDAIEEILGSVKEINATIFQEAFSAPKPDFEIVDGEVRFLKSAIEADAKDSANILELAEASGLKPKHGCRMGICQKCRCTASGTFRNTHSGETTTIENETIRICCNQPVGQVSVDI